MPEKILLKPGEEPLKMNFTEHRNYRALIGMGLMMLMGGVCCLAPVLWWVFSQAHKVVVK